MEDTLVLDTILENEEFFYDDSFIDYNNINIKEFFYDDSFEDYIVETIE